MRAELVQLDVPARTILLESTSRNTYDERLSLRQCFESLAFEQDRTRHDGYTHAPIPWGPFAPSAGIRSAIVPDSQARQVVVAVGVANRRAASS